MAEVNLPPLRPASSYLMPTSANCFAIDNFSSGVLAASSNLPKRFRLSAYIKELTSPSNFCASANKTASSIPYWSITDLATSSASFWLLVSYFNPLSLNPAFAASGTFVALSKWFNIPLSFSLSPFPSPTVSVGSAGGGSLPSFPLFVSGITSLIVGAVSLPFVSGSGTSMAFASSFFISGLVDTEASTMSYAFVSLNIGSKYPAITFFASSTENPSLVNSFSTSLSISLTLIPRLAASFIDSRNFNPSAYHVAGLPINASLKSFFKSASGISFGLLYLSATSFVSLASLLSINEPYPLGCSFSFFIKASTALLTLSNGTSKTVARSLFSISFSNLLNSAISPPLPFSISNILFSISASLLLPTPSSTTTSLPDCSVGGGTSFPVGIPCSLSPSTFWLSLVSTNSLPSIAVFLNDLRVSDSFFNASSSAW